MRRMSASKWTHAYRHCCLYISQPPNAFPAGLCTYLEDLAVVVQVLQQGLPGGRLETPQANLQEIRKVLRLLFNFGYHEHLVQQLKTNLLKLTLF